MRKEQHQKHMDLSFHFLKRRTNTLISACLPMQVQQTHSYQVDSYMKAANAKVYPRLSLRENIKTSNIHHGKCCLQELLNQPA